MRDERLYGGTRTLHLVNRVINSNLSFSTSRPVCNQDIPWDGGINHLSSCAAIKIETGNAKLHVSVTDTVKGRRLNASPTHRPDGAIGMGYGNRDKDDGIVMQRTKTGTVTSTDGMRRTANGNSTTARKGTRNAAIRYGNWYEDCDGDKVLGCERRDDEQRSMQAHPRNASSPNNEQKCIICQEIEVK